MQGHSQNATRRECISPMTNLAKDALLLLQQLDSTKTILVESYLNAEGFGIISTATSLQRL